MRNVIFVIFILPVILSFVLGGYVLAQVTSEPDRELNMSQFEMSNTPIVQTGALKIIGLKGEYTTSESIEIEISVSDPFFDCGDLYLTIYDISSSQKVAFTQSGYFSQCFDRNNLNLPTEEKFSETIDTPGKYQLVAEINDENQQKTITVSKEFTVK